MREREEILSIASDLREGYMTTDEAKEQLMQLFGDSTSTSFNSAEVEQMYNHLKALFHRSQMNGLVEIDPYDRAELKKLLKLPDSYR